MALTRKMLKGMGLTEEQVDTIIEAHSETVEGVKEKLTAAEEKAKTVDALQKQVENLTVDAGYKAKYEKEHADFEAYKADAVSKATKAAKETAAKAYFESKNITGANLAIALRGAKDEIAAIELDDNGKIKDCKALDSLVGGEYAGLVVKKTERGARTDNPPAGTGDGKMTRAEIFKKDDKGRYVLSTAERQEALAKNPELLK